MKSENRILLHCCYTTDRTLPLHSVVMVDSATRNGKLNTRIFVRDHETDEVEMSLSSIHISDLDAGLKHGIWKRVAAMPDWTRKAVT